MKYLKELNVQVGKHNLTGRLQHLLHQCTVTNRCTDADERTYRVIATQLYQSDHCAEDKCK